MHVCNVMVPYVGKGETVGRRQNAQEGKCRCRGLGGEWTSCEEERVGSCHGQTAQEGEPTRGGDVRRRASH